MLDSKQIIAKIEQRINDLDEMTTIVSIGYKRQKYMDKSEELKLLLRIIGD